MEGEATSGGRGGAAVQWEPRGFSASVRATMRSRWGWQQRNRSPNGREKRHRRGECTRHQKERASKPITWTRHLDGSGAPAPTWFRGCGAPQPAP